MDLYTQIADKIIHQQESVIGPLAFDQARLVSGIQIAKEGNVVIKGNSKEVITQLVKQYEQLFGQASVEVCKDAVREIKPQPDVEELPEILR